MKILTLHCDYIRYRPLKKALKEPEDIADKGEKESKECLVVFTAVEKGDKKAEAAAVKVRDEAKTSWEKLKTGVNNAATDVKDGINNAAEKVEEGAAAFSSKDTVEDTEAKKLSKQLNMYLGLPSVVLGSGDLMLLNMRMQTILKESQKKKKPAASGGTSRGSSRARSRSTR